MLNRGKEEELYKEANQPIILATGERSKEQEDIMETF